LLDSMDGIVYIMGKIPQQEVHQAYMDADYSIFIREDKRSSHAGFPTKLAESMAAGTPVITNDTGDIGLYLKNGENGYLLQDTSPESIKKVLEKILQLTSEETIEMRSKARKTAEESFDFRVYKQLMKDFLEDVCG
jgi:glycosyltransferase involved in cell wall biosynthesis